MHSAAFTLILMTVTCGCGTSATAATASHLSPSSSVAEVLDALEARGRNLQTFTASVTMTESDPDTGDSSRRTGKVWLQTRDDQPRFRAMFDRKESNNRIVEDRVEYLLDGRNLVDRMYRTKTEVTRQVLKPGEKLNLLKLGEGPFPLPIGQPKEEVLRAFEVTRVAGNPDDPAETIHITLVPKPASQFERKFKSIDVWVNLNDHMPQRIETLDPNGVTLRTTDLADVKINAPLTDAELSMPKIDESWTRIDEPFQNDSPPPQRREK